MHGAGLRIDTVPAVKHQGGDTVLGEQGGARDPGRARPDDDHGVLARRVHPDSSITDEIVT